MFQNGIDRREKYFNNVMKAIKHSQHILAFPTILGA